MEIAIGIVVVGYIIDLCFIVDLCLNFFTAYIKKKTKLPVNNMKKIARKYVKTWRFYVDLLASIPFEFFFSFL